MNTLTRGQTQQVAIDGIALQAMSPEDCQADARSKRDRLIMLWKSRTCNVVTVAVAAEAMRCSKYRIEKAAKAGSIWSGFAPVVKNGNTYHARVVDLDECRGVLAGMPEKQRRRPRVKKERKKPPSNMASVSVLAKEIASTGDTLTSWIRRHELPGEKFIVANGRFGHMSWHVDRDEAIALFRKKRANHVHGRNLKRNTDVSVTPLIRELWGLGE